MKQIFEKIQNSLRFFGILLIFAITVAANFIVYGPPKEARANDFNPNNIISDGTFTNKNSMNEGDIQRFLEQKGSLLKDFSQDGKRASKIIYEAAQGITSANIWANFGHPDWNEDVSINPQALLVTIQKEEGLIEGYYADPANYNQVRIDWAMGYGYTESTIYEEYKGFYNQINLGAWQLYWNYKRAQGLGYSDYQVGQDFCFDDWNGTHCGRFDNRATASLYRYTPHVYNGNYNFWFYFNKWFVEKEYQTSWTGQNNYPSLFPGEAYQFEVSFRNTGVETWRKGTVFLGTNRPQDRISMMIREGDGPSGWYSGNRIWMIEDQVGPGEVGTFRFWMRVPNGTPAGTYREYFNLVADSITWLNDVGVYWDINVKSSGEKYHHQWLSQNEYPSISPGQGYNFVLNVKNTGSITWYRGSVNLGTDEPQDRTSSFIRADVNDPYGHPSYWISSNRIEMLQESVAPGETATFSFWMSAPSNMSPGTYREYFRLVADGITWMEDYGIYWDVSVDYPHAQWVGQSGYPLLHPGEKTTVWIEFKNTGQSTWNKYGSNPVNLGTDRPRDRTSRFHFSDWSSENRISLDQTSVPPGGVGRYSFVINVPSGTPQGTYREYFRLVCDGITWLEDYGVYLDILVN